MSLMNVLLFWGELTLPILIYPDIIINILLKWLIYLKLKEIYCCLDIKANASSLEKVMNFSLCCECVLNDSVRLFLSGVLLLRLRLQSLFFHPSLTLMCLPRSLKVTSRSSRHATEPLFIIVC